METPEQAEQLLADQMPFHVADPTGPLVAELIAADHVVYRPDVLRHFAAGGDYGMIDLRDDLRGVTKPTLILSGADDRTTPAASAHELVALLPHCEEVVLPDCAAHGALRAAGWVHRSPEQLPRAPLGAFGVGLDPLPIGQRVVREDQACRACGDGRCTPLSVDGR